MRCRGHFSWLEVRMSWTQAWRAAMVESLLCRHFSSVSWPEFSPLFVTDHELGLGFTATDELRPTTAALLELSSIRFQRKWIVVMPRGVMYSWVVGCLLALHLHSSIAAWFSACWGGHHWRRTFSRWLFTFLVVWLFSCTVLTLWATIAPGLITKPIVLSAMATFCATFVLLALALLLLKLINIVQQIHQPSAILRQQKICTGTTKSSRRIVSDVQV